MSILPQLIVNSLIAGSIYALIALGFNLIYGATKFFNLAHGVMAAIGGYSVFFFAKKLGLNVYLAITLAVLIAGLIGWLLDLVIFRKLRARKASDMVLLVASLGAFTALQAIIAILFTSQFQTLPSGALGSGIFHIGSSLFATSGSAAITQVQVVALVACVVVYLGLLFVLKKTLLGKAIVAVSDDEEVSRIVGINTNRIMAFVFFIGSAIAGVAGILVGFDTGIEPTMGLPLLLKGVIASIIGGVGSIHGAIVGAFLLGFVENFGIWKLAAEWKDAIAFGVLILFLLFRPNGIFKK